LLAGRSNLIVPTAGHERKHNASRAEMGGCVSGNTYTSRPCCARPEKCHLATLFESLLLWDVFSVDRRRFASCMCKSVLATEDSRPGGEVS